MKLEYEKRTSKKLRQELLDFALKEELEYLRIKCFPWERKPFLEYKVEIRERTYKKELKYGGEYRNHSMHKELEEYVHYIYINVNVIKEIHKNMGKKQRLQKYNRLHQIIRHELCHAFVDERYQFMSKLDNVNNDASPIFLSFLFWINGTSGHNCAYFFKKTENYQNISDYKNFKDFDRYLRIMIKQYNHVAATLSDKQEIKQKNNKVVNIKLITNSFSFSYYDTGMKKTQEITENIINKSEKDLNHGIVTARKWELGSNVDITEIYTLYDRKQDCKAERDIYSTSLNIVKNNRIVSTKNIRGN